MPKRMESRFKFIDSQIWHNLSIRIKENNNKKKLDSIDHNQLNKVVIHEFILI